MEENRLRLNYKWLIIAVCFLVEGVCLGFCSSNKSLYLTAITEALNVERGLFSLNDSCRYIVSAIINIFLGSLVLRFGIKKIFAMGFASLIVAMLIYANATEVLLFYVGGCFLGIGLSFTTTPIVSRIVKQWCKERTGLILGLVLGANGVGGAIATQIVTPIIYQDGNPFGYQRAYQITVWLLIVVGVLAVVFVKEAPQKDKKEEPKKKKQALDNKDWKGIDYETAKSKPYYYFVILGVFFTGMMLQGISAVSVAHMTDSGLDVSYVAKLLSAHVLLLTITKFGVGASYDRFGLRTTLLICNIASVLAVMLLIMSTNSPLGRTSAFMYSLISPIAMPLETVMIPLIANDLFGDLSYDKLLGIFMAANSMGFAIGTPLLNFCHDTLGSYIPVFWASIVLMVIISVGFYAVVTSVERTKKEIMNAYS